MLSLRSFARAAPRSISRLTAQQPRLLSRTPTIFTPRIQPSLSRWSKPFSTTLARKQGNEELIAKLGAEYDLETDYRDDDTVTNKTVKEYMADGPFEITDIPGQEEVVLTRKYNDETIRITFSVADLANNDGQDEQMDPDQGLFGDEDDELPPQQSGGGNTKGSVNQGRTSGGNIRVAPEDSLSPADRPEIDDEGPDGELPPVFPARVNVKITRDGQKGAMLIEATTQDGDFIIDNVCYFADAAHADPETPAQDWKRRNIYAGPPFGNLDEDLQVLLEKYLEDRGVDAKLALFVPEYIDFKEQKEYMRWLKNLKTFLEEPAN